MGAGEVRCGLMEGVRSCAMRDDGDVDFDALFCGEKFTFLFNC